MSTEHDTTLLLLSVFDKTHATMQTTQSVFVFF